MDSRPVKSQEQNSGLVTGLLCKPDEGNELADTLRRVCPQPSETQLKSLDDSWRHPGKSSQFSMRAYQASCLLGPEHNFKVCYLRKSTTSVLRTIYGSPR